MAVGPILHKRCNPGASMRSLAKSSPSKVPAAEAVPARGHGNRLLRCRVRLRSAPQVILPCQARADFAVLDRADIMRSVQGGCRHPFIRRTDTSG